MADDFTSSTDGLAMKAAEAGDKQQRVEEYQPDNHRKQGEMRKLRNHSSAKALAGVNQPIYEHGSLQDGKLFERAPGIVSAAEENHGRDDEAEHEADVSLLHAAPEGEATGRGEKSHQHGHNRKEQEVAHVHFSSWPPQQPTTGNDNDS